MIPVAVSYFDISAEKEWGGELGHLLRVGYSAEIPASVAECNFSLLEEIVFRMEWKGFKEGIDTLISVRELNVYPSERIPIVGETKLVRSRQAFVSRSFLKWETGFPEMAEMSCRISLIPILAAARRSIPLERINGRYRLIPGQVGNPPIGLTPGYEF